jgi:S1-C subfamily serine protease
MADTPDETKQQIPTESLPSAAQKTKSAPRGRLKPVPLTSASPATEVKAEEPAAASSGRLPRSKALTWAMAGILVLALGFGGGWLGAAARGNGTATLSQQKTVLSSQAAVVSQIAKDVGPSVVSVNVTSQTASANPYASLFGGSGSQTQESAGTGIVLTSDGLIMTNRHVVPAGTTSVSITLSDGTVYNDVKVVGRTNDNDSLDVAFLQIPDTKGKSLVPAKIGDSSKVKVGDSVVAIGNALGQFQNTVTSGIISGYGRSLQASASDGRS